MLWRCSSRGRHAPLLAPRGHLAVLKSSTGTLPSPLSPTPFPSLLLLCLQPAPAAAIAAMDATSWSSCMVCVPPCSVSLSFHGLLGPPWPARLAAGECSHRRALMLPPYVRIEPPELHPPPAPVRATFRSTTATSGCAWTPGCFPAAFPPPTHLLRRAPVHTPL